ncbi:MAG: thioredoxin family protein [Candidatus Thermoplasmatota archaeon]
MEDRIKLERAAKEPKIQKLLEKGKITIIDFYAAWCPPCQMLMKVLDGIKEVDVAVKRINVDEENELASRIGIDAVPFVGVFDKEREPFVAFTGYRDEKELRSLIDRARKSRF